jgi:hypothetical protein
MSVSTSRTSTSSSTMRTRPGAGARAMSALAPTLGDREKMLLVVDDEHRPHDAPAVGGSFPDINSALPKRSRSRVSSNGLLT